MRSNAGPFFGCTGPGCRRPPVRGSLRKRPWVSSPAGGDISSRDRAPMGEEPESYSRESSRNRDGERASRGPRGLHGPALNVPFVRAGRTRETAVHLDDARDTKDQLGVEPSLFGRPPRRLAQMLGKRRHPHFSSRSVSDGDRPARDVGRLKVFRVWCTLGANEANYPQSTTETNSSQQQTRDLGKAFRSRDLGVVRGCVLLFVVGVIC